MANEYIERLKETRNDLRMSISSAEQAAENARRLDNDDLAERCWERAGQLRRELFEIETVLDKFDI